MTDTILTSTTESPRKIVPKTSTAPVPHASTHLPNGSDSLATAAPVSIGSAIAAGSANSFAKSDHVHDVQNLTYSSQSPRMTSTVTTLNGSLLLTSASNQLQTFTGVEPGFAAVLPDALTLTRGYNFEFYNNSSQTVAIKYYGGEVFTRVDAGSSIKVVLETNAGSNGTWLTNIVTAALTTTFIPTLLCFEDFLFDAYASTGGNDNAYSFTATQNGGSSDVDGSVSAAGNDYAGIHILDSTNSATARPLVEAFNKVGRLKLGAQQESFEMRVRIETLSDAAQKFTTRYGLMDVSTAGLPTNGVIFSYDPTNPVAQVVTVSITTVANNTQYTVTINGVNYNFTSDANATATEIATGLRTAINADTGAAVTATSGTTVIITAKVPGTAFTYSVGTRLSATLTTANVVYYGTWLFSVINNSTATTIDTGVSVVAGQWYKLKAVVNAAGTSATVYVNDVSYGAINTALPTAALRYLFKLEKTRGTVSRTTSIDYIAWQRIR